MIKYGTTFYMGYQIHSNENTAKSIDFFLYGSWSARLIFKPFGKFKPQQSDLWPLLFDRLPKTSYEGETKKEI